jgi:hypothetical protein
MKATKNIEKYSGNINIIKKNIENFESTTKINYTNDIKSAMPTGYDKMIFINPSQFSTAPGNNYNPGKYGDVELYIMGFITIDELLNKKLQLYLQAKQLGYINNTQYNERINNNEVLRVYNNVYTINNYFIGKPTTYSKTQLETICAPQRNESINYNNKYLVDGKPIFKNINVLWMKTDPDYMLQYELDNINNIVNRFSSKTPMTNPYNFAAATEERAYCDFSFTHIDPITTEKQLIPSLIYKNGDPYYEVYNQEIDGRLTKLNTDSIVIKGITYRLKYYTNFERPYESSFKIKFIMVNGIPYVTNVNNYIQVEIERSITTILPGQKLNINNYLNVYGEINFIKNLKNNIIEYIRFYTDINDSLPVSIIMNYKIPGYILYDIPKINTTKANLTLITHFTSEYIKNIFNNLYNQTIKNRVYMPFNNIFNNTNFISAYTNQEKNILIIRIDETIYNNYIYSLEHTSRVILNWFIQNIITNIDINVINHIAYESKPVTFMYIRFDFPGLRSIASIYLQSINSIEADAYLHEIAHQYMNYSIPVNSVFQSNIYGTYDNLLLVKYREEYNGAIGPHWGFSNVRGQLGGYSDTNIKYINSDINYPLISNKCINFINYLINYINNNNILTDTYINRPTLDITNFTIQKLINTIYLNTNFNILQFAESFNKLYYDIHKEAYVKYYIKNFDTNTLITNLTQIVLQPAPTTQPAVSTTTIAQAVSTTIPKTNIAQTISTTTIAQAASTTIPKTNIAQAASTTIPKTNIAQTISTTIPKTNTAQTISTITTTTTTPFKYKNGDDYFEVYLYSYSNPLGTKMNVNYITLNGIKYYLKYYTNIERDYINTSQIIFYFYADNIDNVYLYLKPNYSIRIGLYTGTSPPWPYILNGYPTNGSVSGPFAYIEAKLNGYIDYIRLCPDSTDCGPVIYSRFTGMPLIPYSLNPTTTTNQAVSTKTPTATFTTPTTTQAVSTKMPTATFTTPTTTQAVSTKTPTAVLTTPTTTQAVSTKTPTAAFTTPTTTQAVSTKTPTAALTTPTAALTTPTAALTTPTAAFTTPTAAFTTPIAVLTTPTTSAITIPTVVLTTPTTTTAQALSIKIPTTLRLIIVFISIVSLIGYLLLL